MTQVLLEEVNHLGNVQAIVECDEQTCYFYLQGADETELRVKSVWVRNLILAPAVLDVASMREGQPPVNPRQYCRHENGAPALSPERLRVVWLPEGNGAALFESNSLLAAIPPWSGQDGMHGYARDCIGQGPLAWDLAEAAAFVSRVQEAEHFVKSWTNENVWPDLRDRLTAAISTNLGQCSNYYAIDGGNWPPKALVRIPGKDCCILVTVGLCILPQPNVDTVSDDPRLIRRIELGAVLPSDWTNDDVTRFGTYISAQSQLPWRRFTWLGHGHTIPCDSWRSRDFTSALLVGEHPAIGPIELGDYLNDPISVLWFLPITDSETQRAIRDGSESLLRELPASRWSMA